MHKLLILCVIVNFYPRGPKVVKVKTYKGRIENILYWRQISSWNRRALVGTINVADFTIPSLLSRKNSLARFQLLLIYFLYSYWTKDETWTFNLYFVINWSKTKSFKTKEMKTKIPLRQQINFLSHESKKQIF